MAWRNRKKKEEERREERKQKKYRLKSGEISYGESGVKTRNLKRREEEEESRRENHQYENLAKSAEENDTAKTSNIGEEISSMKGEARNSAGGEETGWRRPAAKIEIENWQLEEENSIKPKAKAYQSKKPESGVSAAPKAKKKRSGLGFSA